MTRTWKSWIGAWLLLSAASFAVSDGTVSGRVQDSAGKPQMGVVIEVYSSAALPVGRVYTDGSGLYSLKNLLPGKYFIKASADQFLPSVREGLVVKPGSHLLVNLTLTTLIEAFQLLPTKRTDVKADDDWRWTLRSSANRPILRVLEDEGFVLVSEQSNANDLKGRVAFLAGVDGSTIGMSDMSTAFSVEHSLFGSGTMSFTGNVASTPGTPNGSLRASYRREMANGSQPEFSVTFHRFANEDLLTHHAAVGALAMGFSDHTALAPFLDADYGGELQTIQLRGRATAFKPFARVTAHLGESTNVQYRYATSRPNVRRELGFESVSAELTQTDPRFSLQDGTAKLERVRHQEIAVNRRFEKNNFQLAAYSDTLRDPSLLGVGEVGFSDDDPIAADFLADINSNTFNYTGAGYHTNGLRAVVQRAWKNGLTTTADYSFGGALVANAPDGVLALRTQRLHSASAKVSGDIKASGTRWLASYKWVSDSNAVTAVDMFNDSAGRSDAFLNVFVRQRIPTGSFIPVKLEALVDVRNLLAQGYVPFLSPDGNTLYLVQSARSLRGGLSFNF